MIVLVDQTERLYEEFMKVCQETDDGRRLNEAQMSEGMKEIFGFAQELAHTIGSKISSVIKLLKDSEVFKFFASFKFDMAHIQKALFAALDAYKRMVHFIPDLATDLASVGIQKLGDTKQGQKIHAATQKVNEWIKNHKAVLAVSGVVFALLLIVLWLNMSTTGDPEYDFDFSDVLSALTGKLTLVDFLTSKDGLKCLILLAVGVVGFNPVNYFGTGVNIVVSLIKTIADWKGVKLIPGRDSEKEIASAQALV